ncbi:MAG: response regulator [Sulfitobacter sp.]
MNQRIMAIDDSDIAQDFIRSNLVELGFNDVVSFLDPREALEAIEAGETNADLILMDIMMPVIDGIELCARIRGIDAWRDVPIIMLTSRKDMDALTRAFMAGANDFVTKPFNRIELQARMRSSLRLRAETGRRRASESRGSKSPPSGFGGRAQGDAQQNMLGTQLGLQNDLMALSADAQSSVAIIALKIDNLKNEADLPEATTSQIIQDVAQTLSKVSIRAGDSFVHWEDGLFCFAGAGLADDLLRAQAENFIQAVKDADLSTPQAWRQVPVTISAAVCVACEATTVGHRLGQALKLLETQTSVDTASTVQIVNV